jgi:hypothetical protein
MLQVYDEFISDTVKYDNPQKDNYKKKSGPIVLLVYYFEQ